MNTTRSIYPISITERPLIVRYLDGLRRQIRQLVTERDYDRAAKAKAACDECIKILHLFELMEAWEAAPETENMNEVDA